MFSIEKMHNVYKHLQDEKSKYIFEQRVLYDITNDYKYMVNIIRYITENICDVAERIGLNSNEKYVFYGAGNDFINLQILCPDFSFELVCDRDVDKQKNGFRGINVISPEQLYETEDVKIVVTSSLYADEIINELVENGIPQENIINAGKVIGDIHKQLYLMQYFEDGIMEHSPNEIFVDGGCFDCSTDELFVDWCGGNYSKIYAFEPDDINYENCKERLAEDELVRIELINAGVWSKNEILSFVANHGQGAKIGDNGINTIQIDARSIDSVVGEDKVSFIKLDVEGAELEALKGAEQTILRNHPKLAICIYHKHEDIFEIPAYILSLHDDYKLYIRHYQLSKNETIVYAV